MTPRRMSVSILSLAVFGFTSPGVGLADDPGAGGGLPGFFCEPACSAGSLDCNGTVAGSLAEGDCDDGVSFFDAWTLEISVESQIDITLASSDFDTFLGIANRFCRLRAPPNDDCTKGNSDLSCVSVTLFPGSYVVVVASTDGTAGDYELSVSCSSACDAECVAGSLDCGGTVAGSLASGDCDDGTSNIDSWTLEIADASEVELNLTSTDFDPRLLVRSPTECRQVQLDEDCSAGNSDLSCGSFTLLRGSYVVVAASQDETGGAYELSVNCKVFPPEPVSELRCSWGVEEGGASWTNALGADPDVPISIQVGGTEVGTVPGSESSATVAFSDLEANADPDGVAEICVVNSTGIPTCCTVSAPPVFLRGDANCDGCVNEADAEFISVFLGLAKGGPVTPCCVQAMDANGDGRVSGTDPLWLLRYLDGGSPPPTPGPEICGPNPFQSELDCANYPDDVCGVGCPKEGPVFLRGDCDGDGQLPGAVNDAIANFQHCFVGREVSCLAACDADGDGNQCSGVNDGLRILLFVFQNGSPPPAPFPDCGTSRRPEDEELGCETSGCEAGGA